MSSYHKEATVGLLIVVAVAVFLAGTIWLQGQSVLAGEADLQVHFTDIGNLKEGSAVRTSGAPVGTVVEIAFEGMGNIIVSLEFTAENLHPTDAATAEIMGIGMLGDMVVDFDPGQGAPLEPGALIEGSMAPGLFDKGADLADQASVTLTTLNQMMDTALVSDLRNTLNASERLMRYFADSERGPTAEVNETLRHLQSVAARFDTTLAGLDAAALSARLDSTMQAATALTTRLSGMTASMDSILTRINNGEGSLGKLVGDSTLYLELSRTMAATRALVDSLAAHPERLGITVRVF